MRHRDGSRYFFQKARFIGLSFVAAGALWFLVSGPAVSSALAMPAEEFKEWRTQWLTLRVAETDKAVAQAQRLLAEGKFIPPQARVVYRDIAYAQADRLKDTDAALTTLAEAKQKSTIQADYFAIVALQADILSKHSRMPDAEVLLVEQWPQAMEAGAEHELAGVYVQILQSQKKYAAVVEVLQSTLLRTPALIAEGRFSGQRIREANNPATVLTEALLKEGRHDEALSWAKVQFMLCRYDETALQWAHNAIVKALLAKHLAPARVAELVEAHQSTDKPGPLNKVLLPAFDRTLLLHPPTPASRAQDRITHSILLGDWTQAMLEARELLLGQPQSSAGALEVCRVFKAYDLKLTRANAFLEYYRTGQGENPITAFMKDVEMTSSLTGTSSPANGVAQ